MLNAKLKVCDAIIDVTNLVCCRDGSPCPPTSEDVIYLFRDTESSSPTLFDSCFWWDINLKRVRQIQICSSLICLTFIFQNDNIIKQNLIGGCDGTGRRAGLRHLWILLPCGFKSHRPHHKQRGHFGDLFVYNVWLRMGLEPERVLTYLNLYIYLRQNRIFSRKNHIKTLQITILTITFYNG